MKVNFFNKNIFLGRKLAELIKINKYGIRSSFFIILTNILKDFISKNVFLKNKKNQNIDLTCTN